MKPIIFARIADMKYYKGITPGDAPANGGSYVQKTGLAHECMNFARVHTEEGQDYCLGFVQINGRTERGTIRLEKIVGCEAMKGQPFVEGVTVVFCSKAMGSRSTRVVGFYKNATVFNEYQVASFPDDDDQYYSFIAKAEDCVLLPFKERHGNSAWYVPTSGRDGNSYGFGRANIWYAQGSDENEKLRAYLERMIRSVEEYDGENWLDKSWVSDSKKDRR